MRSSFRPQSELRDRLVGLPPSYDFAHCQSHCTTCAAQSVKGSCWFGVVLAFLPVIPGSSLWHIKHRARVAHVAPFKGASQDTCWRQPCNTCLAALWEAFLSESFRLGVKPWWGSSLIVELSHMVHRLCKAPSIPLSFNLAIVLPRRDT